MKADALKLIIWDWYKTLSYHHFYEEIKLKDEDAYEKIKDYLLRRPDLVKQWGKGSIEFRELHAKFAEISGTPQSEFDKVLSKLGDRAFDVDQDLLNYVKKFSELGIEQAVAADNFDVWDEFFLPQYSQYLHLYFTRIFSVRRYTILDHADQKEFFKKIVRDMNINFSECLLIDDNSDLTKIFQDLGGNVITHKNKQDLLDKLAEIV
jgi:hypothetical protein